MQITKLFLQILSQIGKNALYLPRENNNEKTIGSFRERIPGCQNITKILV